VAVAVVIDNGGDELLAPVSVGGVVVGVFGKARGRGVTLVEQDVHGVGGVAPFADEQIGAAIAVPIPRGGGKEVAPEVSGLGGVDDDAVDIRGLAEVGRHRRAGVFKHPDFAAVVADDQVLRA